MNVSSIPIIIMIIIILLSPLVFKNIYKFEVSYKGQVEIVKSFCKANHVDYVPTPPVPSDPRYKYRPIIGGLRYEFWKPFDETYEVWARYTCTIGIPAYYQPCKHCPVMWGFLTAGHCLDNLEYSVYQNDSRKSDDLVGYSKLSSIYVPLDDNKYHTDSAFVVLWITNDDTTWPPANILLPRIWYSYEDIASYVFIVGIGSNPQYIEKVYMSGQYSRTKELIVIDYKWECLQDEEGRIWCGHFLKLWSSNQPPDGDSGSPIYRLVSGPYAWVYGIIVGYDLDNPNIVYAGYIKEILNTLPQADEAWPSEAGKSLKVFICPNPYNNPC